MQLLRQWDNGKLPVLETTLIRDRIPVVLMQILIRTLQSQEKDGSWSQMSCEITSYALLTLSSVISAPWLALLYTEISRALHSGREFLAVNHHRWQRAEYLWVEKVSYFSPVLSETYSLAAIKAQRSPHVWTESANSLFEVLPEAVQKFSRFFSKVPLFSTMPEWKLNASLIESSLFLPQLKRRRLDIFPRKDMAEDKYVELIPATWTACNNLGMARQSTSILWDMMIISMLNYQVDEYLEGVVGVEFEHNLEPIRALIDRICRNLMVRETSNTSTDRSHFEMHNEGIKNGHERHNTDHSTEANGWVTETVHHLAQPNGYTDRKPPNTLSEIESVLSRFTHYIFTHPSVLHSPSTTQHQLRTSMATFLHAHVTQISDNARFSRQPRLAAPDTINASPRPTIFATPTSAYYTWVRSTSADHTSCPYSFLFFACLIAKPGEEAFESGKAKYLAHDLCRHLATMCRMYNDYGSVARDEEEGNLNSMNFPEFHAGGGDGDQDAIPLGVDSATHGVEAGRKGKAESIKKELFWLAQYEREGLRRAMGKLKGEVSAQIWDAVTLFVDVTDLYGQIYVQRDVASRMK